MRVYLLLLSLLCLFTNLASAEAFFRSETCDENEFSQPLAESQTPNGILEASTFVLSTNKLFLSAQSGRINSQIQNLQSQISSEKAHQPRSWTIESMQLLIKDKQATRNRIQKLIQFNRLTNLFSRRLLTWFDLTKDGIDLLESELLATIEEFGDRTLKSSVPIFELRNTKQMNGLRPPQNRYGDFFSLNREGRSQKGEPRRNCDSSIRRMQRLRKAALAPLPKRQTDDPDCITLGSTLRAVNNVHAFLYLAKTRLSMKGPRIEYDLSDYFPAPVTQRDSMACFGFAYANDLHLELKKMFLENMVTPEVSSWDVFRHMFRYVSDTHCERGGPDQIENQIPVRSIVSALENLSSSSMCSTESSGSIKIAVDSSVCMQDLRAVNGDFFVRLLDSDQSPTILIDSESAEPLEEWMKILPRDSQFQHAVSVVSYGEDISPFTLKKVRYFTIRDSLVPEPYHYKISEEELLAHFSGVYKITSIGVR